mmetsp:Transcript_17643/g.25444  ORF Transcript_17643/g.25444 Transcript_17643/m.25444 type:complete len:353 (+) Transcript_17643:1076-2134(+)
MIKLEWDYPLLILAVLIFLWLYTSREDENIFFKHIVRKISVYLDSASFMIYSKDSKGVGPKYNKDPDLIASTTTSNKRKRLVFIRHGESDWNNVFNKGFNLSMFARLANAIRQEFFLLPSADSVFIDSPLNFEGIEQAIELRKYLQSGDQTVSKEDSNTKLLIQMLSGKDTTTLSSIIVSSSLRRAIATTTLSLWNRISQTGEKIHILSSLQEMSRNVDTYALSTANSCPDLPFARVAPHCDNFSTEVFNCSDNFGNKTRTFYGIKRLQAFNEWVFKRNEDVIIVGGHSLWFKNYFLTYLPHKVDHDAKKKKIVNSGVVAFDVYSFEANDGTISYRIDPSSLVTVYGGFTSK